MADKGFVAQAGAILALDVADLGLVSQAGAFVALDVANLALVGQAGAFILVDTEPPVSGPATQGPAGWEWVRQGARMRGGPYLTQRMG